MQVRLITKDTSKAPSHHPQSSKLARGEDNEDKGGHGLFQIERLI